MFKQLLKVTLLGFFGHSLASAQLQPARFIDNNGGLVDRYSTLAAPQNTASEIQNVMLDDRGQLSKRTAQDTIGSTTTAISTMAVTGIGYHGGSNGFYTIVTGTSIWRTGNTLNGNYTSVIGTATLTGISTNLVQFTDFQDYAIGCSLSDPPFKLKASGNAAKLIAVSTVAKTCAGFGNYLVLGNTTEGTTAFPSRVRWSDLNDPDIWPANNYIDVEPDDADGVISLIQFQGSVYIFKRRSVHQLIITGLAGAEAFITRPVARGLGAVSRMSVQVIDNVGIMFQGQNGIYLYDGSNITLVSDNIQRTFDGIASTRLVHTVGAVYRTRNQYWLAYSTSSTNTQVAVYDYIQNAWTVYAGIEANTIGSGEDSNGQPVLLTGSTAGFIHSQDTELNQDEKNGVSTPIESFYVTQDLHLDSPEVEKSFKYVYVFTITDSVTTVTVQAAYNLDPEYTDTYSIALEQSGVLWDSALWDTAIWPASVQRIFRKDLNRNGRTIRLRFSNTAENQKLGVLGWTIVYDAEDYKE